MIGRTVGSYRVDRLLGESNLGPVYLATHVNTRTRVALRVIHARLAADTQFRNQFMRTAAAASALQHDNIARVLEFDTLDNTLYLVTDYISEGTLRAYLRLRNRQSQALTLAESVAISRQIGDALSYAHRVNLIHRHVRPENILIKQQPENPAAGVRAVLADFATANLVDSIPGSQAVLVQDMLPYMPPEQLRGDRVDPRSDLYALGILLYEMVTGSPPFQPRTVQDAMQQHMRTPVVPPSRTTPGLPRDLDRVILRSLAKNPNERYQTINEMMTDVRRVLPDARSMQVDRPAQGAQSYQTRYESQPPVPPPMPAHESIPAQEQDRGRARLIYSQEGQNPQIYWLDQPVTVVGRGADASLRLSGDLISRQHARIDRGNDGYYRLMDTGSTNGVFLGTQRLTAMTPQRWNPGEVARIGSYWLRLEVIGSEAQQRQAGIVPAAGAAGAGIGAVVPAAAGMTPEQRTTDRIDARLIEKSVSVSAGERAVISLDVYNQGSDVDHFGLEMRGLPSNWYTLPRDDLHLMNGQRQIVQITLHPPHSEQTRGGLHEFSILVRSRQTPGDYVTQNGRLEVESFHRLRTEIKPRRLTPRRSGYLSIINNGNAPETFNLSASDPEQALNVQFDPSQIMVEPGQTAQVGVTARYRDRRLIGMSRVIPFTIRLDPARPDGESRTQMAEFSAAPVIPAWALSLALLSIVACLSLAVIAALLSGLQGRITPLEMTETQVAIAVTESGFTDSDGDLLSDEREQEVGTDPLNGDTDGDGLSDAEEVNSYGTDPLNRDTDSDTLTDGQEVNQGTLPTNPDTDGDGINDAVDAAPLLTSTPTPDAAATQTAGGEVAAASQTAEQAVANATQDAATPTPDPPGVIINDPPVIPEGDVADSTRLIFTVSLSKPNPGPEPIVVNYTVANGSAQDGTDFDSGGAEPAGSITFNATESTKTLAIPIISDTEPEITAETFTVTLTSATGAILTKSTGIGTINDDDNTLSLPIISISDASATECDSGTTPMTFTISISEAPAANIEVPFLLSPGTASATSDYTENTASPLTFTAGNDADQSITVNVVCDEVPEPTETFSVVLQSAPGATFAKNIGVGTILDNDAPVTVSVNDVTVLEGGTGAEFTVLLSDTLDVDLSIDWNITDITTEPDDYTSAGDTFPITAGNLSWTFTVPINDDDVFEGDETFQVEISPASAPANLIFADDTGIGTITDNDAAPTIVIDDVTLAECDTPTTEVMMTFTATIDPATAIASVDWRTESTGSAAAGTDYTTSSGTLSFNSMAATQTLDVPVLCDDLAEPDESFQVILSNAAGAVIVDNTGTGLITNNDTITVSIGNAASVTEGATGTVPMIFPVTLSQPNPGPGAITVTYSTQDGTASAGSDYTALTNQTLSFPSGANSATITVDILGDTLFETDQTLDVVISNPQPASLVSLGTATGTGTILNDDASLTISINDPPEVAEGDSVGAATGISFVVFTVSLNQPNPGPGAVTVRYDTCANAGDPHVGGLACAGDADGINATSTLTNVSDYIRQTGILSFPPGTSSQTITIDVVSDTSDDGGDLTFQVRLDNASGATISDSVGDGIIADDD